MRAASACLASLGKRDNDVATSSTRIGPGPIMGLTRAGYEVVRQILAAGALVDVSDASALSIDEVIDMARAWHLPVIATHSNARALADSPWNLADAQIREIAASNPLLGPSGGLRPRRVRNRLRIRRELARGPQKRSGFATACVRLA